jgi:hypothetical protein
VPIVDGTGSHLKPLAKEDGMTGEKKAMNRAIARLSEA